jgi:hypothetical protein
MNSPTCQAPSPSPADQRVLREGYGPGAWHGPDLKAALAGVAPTVAFWRPAPGRHSIAEIALHHAYCVRAVRSQLSGQPAGAFVLPGDDWFELNDERTLPWNTVLSVVETEHARLAALVDDIASGRAVPAMSGAERFERVLGITCHAVYHAGQVQLLRRLAAQEATVS